MLPLSSASPDQSGSKLHTFQTLAEGCSRSSEVDYSRVVEIATASLFEPVAQATIGRNQGFLDQSGYQQVYDAAEMQIRMLSGLRISLSPS